MEANKKHNIYLELAILLSTRAETSVFPNPMVGAIITNPKILNLDFANKHSKDLLESLSTLSQKINLLITQNPIDIIAADYHRAFGEAHAEVNTIKQAKDFYQRYSQELKKLYQTEKDFFADCTIYVSLEPCSHHGKTPPCSDLILDTGIKELVYAMNDPNPLVSGKGLTMLANSGVEVIGPNSKEVSGEINNQAKYTNRAFIKWIKAQSPWITLKVASTPDGRMITSPEEPRWITNSNSRKLVHKMRSCHQLLITGIKTVKVDNPSLNVRHTAEAFELDSIKDPDVLIMKSSSDFTEEERKTLEIFQNNKIRKVIEHKSKNLKSSVEEFSKLGYNKVMVEAGPILTKAFLEADLVDEIVHFEPLNARSKDLAIKQIVERYEQYQTYTNCSWQSEIISGNDHNEADDIYLKINRSAD